MNSCYYVIIVILQSNKSLTTPLCLLIMPTLRNNETVCSINTVAPLLLCLTLDLVDMTVNQCCHRLIKQFCCVKRFPGWLKSSSTLFLKNHGNRQLF